MKNLLITLATLAVFSSSCRKIIDIDQEESDIKTVIEANLFEGTQDFIVQVSKTGNFFGDNSTKQITNASVTLNSLPLTNLGNGKYELPAFTSIAGTEYTLVVSENGNTFESTVTMPASIPIDDLTYFFQPESPFSDEGYITQIAIQDPAGVANFYRILIDIQGESYGDIEDLILLDDLFVDGNRIEFPLFGIDVAQLGDTVSVDLFTTDESTFVYLDGLDEALSGGNGAPPANPQSNFSNGALGNFNVYARDSKKVVVQ